ncbi:hypothetical protein [Idiomarina seosinensis]|uniref:Uncharacterized protein n=1 Tax=Idiomarina seosinensis TaxID=281739 RepID=A0A432ZG62_9GAMM|nr:hypothetical protein [Idiomarina seosinensis]RUO76977.1 hypothetical protein CWI81_00265 [Idiomarina seosinensis]
MTITRVGLLLIASSVMVACGQPDTSTDLQEQQMSEQPKVTATQDIKELGLEIRRMVQTPNADHPDQCKIVAMGHKPCGGPERYLLYSTKTMNEQEETEFLNKLEQYNQLSRRHSEKSGMVSDCQMLPEPTAVVRDGFCIPAEKNTM